MSLGLMKSKIFKLVMFSEFKVLCVLHAKARLLPNKFRYLQPFETVVACQPTMVLSTFIVLLNLFWICGLASGTFPYKL